MRSVKKKNKNSSNCHAKSDTARGHSTCVASSAAADREDREYAVMCCFIEDSGNESEWMKFSARRFMMQIGYVMTASSLIDFLFSKIYTFDEKDIRISFDDGENYVLLDHLDEISEIPFNSWSLKIQLKQSLSIYQRFLALERDN